MIQVSLHRVDYGYAQDRHIYILGLWREFGGGQMQICGVKMNFALILFVLHIETNVFPQKRHQNQEYKI